MYAIRSYYVTMSYTISQATPKDILQLLPLLQQLFAIEADFEFDEAKHFKALTLIIADVMCDVRITSYNVCYTKLLRG